jgi:hypothetical protein
LAYTIPTTPPEQVRLGTSWFWDVSYPDFPASDGWQLNLYFRGPTDLTVAWASGISADGDAFAVRVTPALATGLTTAGKYLLVGTVTLSGEVHEVERRHLLVLRNATTAVNAKSFDRQMLEAVETALLAGVSSSSETKRITINGRTIEYRDRAELDVLHARYTYLVAIEENPTGRIVHEAEFVRG